MFHIHPLLLIYKIDCDMPYREQIDKSRIPANVAIIMDGNGRWAKQRGQALTASVHPWNSTGAL